MDTENYEHLEGMELTVRNDDGELVEAVVAAIDPDIGVSLVENGTKDQVVYCILGPSSVVGKDLYNTPQDLEDYKKILNPVLEMLQEIKDDTLDVFDFEDKEERQTKLGYKSHTYGFGDCPFGV